MSNCLLCAESLRTRTTFSSILFFQQEKLGICSSCQASFKEIAELHCPSCYKSGTSDICSDCRHWQARGKHIDHRAIFQYNPAMADYFSKYKFQGDYLLRQLFAQQIKAALSAYSDYTLVPIPLSPERLEERGFNQVMGLLDAAGLPYKELLGKIDSQKQSSKSREERLDAEQVFYLLEEDELPEKIILVDDIYTTGATIQLAVGLFMKTGQKEIKTFSLSR